MSVNSRSVWSRPTETRRRRRPPAPKTKRDTKSRARKTARTKNYPSQVGPRHRGRVPRRQHVEQRPRVVNVPSGLQNKENRRHDSASPAAAAAGSVNVKMRDGVVAVPRRRPPT
jgi:hypothetical protein